MDRLHLGRFRVLLPAAAVFLGVASALRAALIVRSGADADLTDARMIEVLGIGLLLDLLAFLYAALPVTAYLWFAPGRWVRLRAHRWIAAAVWAVFVYACLFAATTEWFFWDEFGSRFNFVAVDYLVYTKEVVGNIRESYPVHVVLPALLVPAAAIVAMSWRRVLTALESPAPFRARLRPALALLAVPALGMFAISDGVADFTDNRVANQLARDGIHSLFAAFRNAKLDYDAFYVTRPERQLVPRLRAMVGAPADREATDLTRRVGGAGPELRPNVVLVCVESLSASFLAEFRWEDGAEGGVPRQRATTMTPRLDELSQRSLFFTRMYSTGTRTVRGLEALSLSFPPTPGESVVKRPGNEGLFSSGFLFRDRGYDTRFVYGGYGAFDNMNAFFGANGFDVVDRTDLTSEESTFGNIWGVCDEDLFNRTLKECDASHAAGRPFFNFVMTTSNHRPFTYPDGRVAVPSGTGRAGAVAYTDYAIGKFLDDAARKPWFDDTVFVIVADHCSSSRGKTELPVDRFHIPCWVYAPKLVPARRCDELCSQIDVTPTLLGLLGWSYESRFFGVDVLRRPPHRALLCNYLHVGLYDGERLLTLGVNREVTMDEVSGGGRRVRRAAVPDPALTADAVTWFQGAGRMLSTGRQTRLPSTAPPR